MMNLVVYNKDKSKSFSIKAAPSNEKNHVCVWLASHEGDGGQFSEDDVADALYEALEEFFTEHF